MCVAGVLVVGVGLFCHDVMRGGCLWRVLFCHDVICVTNVTKLGVDMFTRATYYDGMTNTVTLERELAMSTYTYELDMNVNGVSRTAYLDSLSAVVVELELFMAECRAMGVRGTYTVESANYYRMSAVS